MERGMKPKKYKPYKDKLGNKYIPLESLVINKITINNHILIHNDNKYGIDLLIKDNEDKIIIYDHQHNELGYFTQQFNQEEKSFQLFDYNFSKASIIQLQEYLIFQLEVPIVCHAEIIKIDNFPLKKELINEILEIFKKDYENSYTIEKIEESNEKCNLEIKIKQPKRTHYIQQAYLRYFSSNKAEWIPDNNKKKARRKKRTR